MDAKNRFETTTTIGLLRLEYLLLLLACLAVAVVQYAKIDWALFSGIFVFIDLVGYLPGAIAYRRRNGVMPKVYYVMYNTMHSASTWGVVLGLWSLVDGPQWAFLAVPIHLAGDRAIFGNFMKSFAVPYEPALLPEFQRFQAELSRVNGRV